MLSFQHWIPACAGMTWGGKNRHEAGAPETGHPSFRPTDALGARRYEEGIPNTSFVGGRRHPWSRRVDPFGAGWPDSV